MNKSNTANTTDTVEIIRRNKLLNLTKSYTSKPEEDCIPTMENVIKSAQQIKLQNSEAKVLMGSNVYTVDFQPFVRAVHDSFESVATDSVDETMIQKLLK